MAKTRDQDSQSNVPGPFELLEEDAFKKARTGCAHVFGKGYRCATDELGYKTPRGRGPAELVLDASEGFIPLWEKGVTLRWRFNENSFLQFTRPAAAKKAVRNLMSKGLLLWQDAVPVKFAERTDAWDFEVIVRERDDCDINGCTLASAFFPDQGRHQLFIYPKSFEQSQDEQIETMAHEFGHVFGLRHFFAQLHETAWASEVFGEHQPFSIMNYGDKSEMTEQDRRDLKMLYTKVWAGELKQINGTPIRLVRPYHMS
ncbi:MAG: matrixin family metalloprotease [Rhodanobacteraceae bacterium]|nr:matrixin family metalloprotease [Rhodanobacteraceae bacterium]